MIWIILWVAIAIFAFQGMFLDPTMAPQSAGEFFFIGLFYIFILCAAALLCGGAGYGIGQLFPSAPVEGEHQILAAIRDKDGVSGQFFLGSGFVESKPYYFYYQNVAGGGLRPGKLDADGSVTVYQEARPDAELVIFNWKVTYPGWAWVVCLPHSESDSQSFDFHVPTGTVKAGYSM